MKIDFFKITSAGSVLFSNMVFCCQENFVRDCNGFNLYLFPFCFIDHVLCTLCHQIYQSLCGLIFMKYGNNFGLRFLFK